MKVVKFQNRGKLIVYGKESKLITSKLGQPLPEHITFLNSILTNDIKSLNDSHFNYNLMLSEKGYPVDDFFVYRLGDRFLLDFEGDTQEKIERFNSLKLSLKVYFEKANFHHYFIFGEKIEDFIEKKFNVIAPPGFKHLEIENKIIANNPLRLGITGFDIFSPDELYFENIINEEEFENLRIKKCVPKINKELKEGIIPLETNIWQYAISFNKGCYTGQEVIARIYYRGKPPRKMVKLRLEKPVEENSSIFYSDKKVGIVTSISKDLEAIGFILNPYLEIDRVYNTANTELKLIAQCEDLLNQK